MTLTDQQQHLISDLTVAGHQEMAQDVATERSPDLFAFYAETLASVAPRLSAELDRFAHRVLAAREAGEYAPCHQHAA